MKKVISLIFLSLFLSSIAYAEKYVCSYLFNGEPNSIVYERKINTFMKSNGAEDDIIFEDADTLVLSSTYSFLGTSSNEPPSTFTALIDKKRLTFVFIGLQYKRNSGIAQGTCKVF